MLKTQNRSVFITLAAVALLLAACAGPAAPPPTTTAPPPTSTSTATPVKATPTSLYGGVYPDIARVSLEDAKAAFDAGTATFVDVRGSDRYALGHIPGAVWILFANVEEHLAELDKQEWIITYCG